MFGKGEIVFYENKGVCEVMDVITMNLQGIPKDKLFYVLHPYFTKDDKIFTPIDNDKIIMRKLITKEEVDQLVGEISEIEELKIDNEKMREETYKECIRSCECKQWVRIIKTLKKRRNRRIQEGKKTTASDDRYLKLAENNLYSEISVRLGVSRLDVAGFLEGRFEEN